MQTRTLEGRCMKCRKTRPILNPEIALAKNGMLVARGHCHICDTRVYKTLLKKDILCEFDCDQLAPDIIKACDTVTKETASYLASHDWELYRVPDDFFEKMIAEIFASFGFEVQLNVRLGGPGKGHEADIVMFRKISGVSKPIGYVIECKRFSEHRKVDLTVAAKLFGLKENYARQWGLDRAILATTSTVTKDVMSTYGERWDFEINDHSKIVQLLQEYSKSNSGLYLRKQGLLKPASDLVLASLNIGGDD